MTTLKDLLDKGYITKNEIKTNIDIAFNIDNFNMIAINIDDLNGNAHFTEHKTLIDSEGLRQIDELGIPFLKKKEKGYELAHSYNYSNYMIISKIEEFSILLDLENCVIRILDTPLCKLKDSNTLIRRYKPTLLGIYYKQKINKVYINTSKLDKSERETAQAILYDGAEIRISYDTYTDKDRKLITNVKEYIQWVGNAGYRARKGGFAYAQYTEYRAHNYKINSTSYGDVLSRIDMIETNIQYLKIKSDDVGPKAYYYKDNNLIGSIDKELILNREFNVLSSFIIDDNTFSKYPYYREYIKSRVRYGKGRLNQVVICNETPVDLGTSYLDSMIFKNLEDLLIKVGIKNCKAKLNVLNMLKYSSDKNIPKNMTGEFLTGHLEARVKEILKDTENEKLTQTDLGMIANAFDNIIRNIENCKEISEDELDNYYLGNNITEKMNVLPLLKEVYIKSDDNYLSIKPEEYTYNTCIELKYNNTKKLYTNIYDKYNFSGKFSMIETKYYTYIHDEQGRYVYDNGQGKYKFNMNFEQMVQMAMIEFMTGHSIQMPFIKVLTIEVRVHNSMSRGRRITDVNYISLCKDTFGQIFNIKDMW